MKSLRNLAFLALGVAAVAAKATPFYSFENNLDGFASSGATLTEDTQHVTHGSKSMKIDWPGGFTWITVNDNNLIPIVLANAGKKLLLDVAASSGAYWKQMGVSYNDDVAGWRQTSEFGLNYSDTNNQTIVINTTTLSLPANNVGFFGMGFSVNGDSSAPRTLWLDNVRFENSTLLYGFEDVAEVNGFTSGAATMTQDTVGATQGTKSMKVSWMGGFTWLFNSNTSGGQAAAVNGSLKRLLFDVTMPGGGMAWCNMMLSLNDATGGWRQSGQVDISTGAGTRTYAINFAGLDPFHMEDGYHQINFSINGPTAVDFPWTFNIDNIRVESAPGNTISGQISLGDFVGDVSTVPVTFDVKAGNTTEQITGTLDANGNYSIVTSLSGAAQIRAKAPHWLSKIANANLGTNPVNISLLNGDCDGDNSVTIFDYVMLSDAFDTSVGDGGFVADADLDGDGTVTIFDYLVLSTNFDQFGEDL
ncbi:MAG: hypothetical protein JST40_03775 [Armatimonadetes bacterium]|nr:hypothetical protein [Armatimonadota bacterium]